MKVTWRLSSSEPKQILSTNVCKDTVTYASEFCKKSYLQFLPGYTHLIACPTGRGKSRMCTHEIIPRAYWQKKKVVLFVNRNKLNDQYHKEIKRAVVQGLMDYNPCFHSLSSDFDHCLRIMSYQQVEEMLAANYTVTLKELDAYDVVIADEIHYLLSDSTFNPRTILSAEVLLMYLARKTRYLMSATLQDIRPVILAPWKYIKPLFTPLDNYYCAGKLNGSDQSEIFNLAVRFTEYKMHPNFDHLKVFYYRKKESMVDLIVSSDSAEKWLVFVSSKTEGATLADEINARYHETHGYPCKSRSACFISAEYRDKEQEQMKQTMEDITEYEDIKSTVLITTSVIDNGVNFKSPNLNNIVIDTDNYISFFQMLGRRRLLTSDDKLNLYIPAEDMHLFERRQKRIGTIIDEVTQVSFSKFDCHVTNLMYRKEDALSDVFRSVVFPMVENVNGSLRSRFVLSDLSLHQYRLMYENYQHIIHRFSTEGSDAFIHEQLSWLGIEYDSSQWVPDNSAQYHRIKLNKILSDYDKCELNSDELDQILEEIRPIIRTVVSEVRSNRMSRKQANKGLEKLLCEYRIDQDKNFIYNINNESFEMEVGQNESN